TGDQGAESDDTDFTYNPSTGTLTVTVLSAVTSVVPSAADGASLGTADLEWADVFLHDDAYVKFGSGQDVHIQRNAANEMTLTASSGVTISAALDVGGTLSLTANDITTTGSIGRDTDNELNWGNDNQLNIVINTVTHGIVDIETGGSDNDSLVTQGYVDDIAVGSKIAHFMDIGIADVDFYVDGATTDEDFFGAILGQSVYARNVTVTADEASGKIAVTGTTADGTVGATEDIDLVNGTAQGVKAFMNITALVSSDTATATFDIGIGDVIGLPSSFDHVDD
ncbi:unnamed protein product, partial [marine sediment metagenome]